MAECVAQIGRRLVVYASSIYSFIFGAYNQLAKVDSCCQGNLFGRPFKLGYSSWSLNFVMLIKTSIGGVSMRL